MANSLAESSAVAPLPPLDRMAGANPTELSFDFLEDDDDDGYFLGDVPVVRRTIGRLLGHATSMGEKATKKTVTR